MRTDVRSSDFPGGNLPGAVNITTREFRDAKSLCVRCVLFPILEDFKLTELMTPLVSPPQLAPNLDPHPPSPVPPAHNPPLHALPNPRTVRRDAPLARALAPISRRRPGDGGRVRGLVEKV